MNILKVFWPILIILAVWFVFSHPFFLQGKVPFPADYLVNNFAPWSAYPGLSGPVKNAATPDVIGQIFPWKSLTIDIWKSGSVPLWNPYSFSGTPLLANYQSAVLSPINLLYFVFPFVSAWSIQILIAPLLAGLFTYLFVRSLKVSRSGATVSAIAFMFCGFITTWITYGTLSYAIAFLPLALFAIEKFFVKPKWYFTILLALTIPLSFFSGHFQISLYFLLFIIYYLLFKLVTTKDLKSFIINLLSILCGLLISAPQLLPSLELYQNAVRSSLFLKIEVIPWSYMSTFIAPDFLGNPVTRNDWFGHYAEWNGYLGIIPLMLAFYALTKRSKIVLFFALAGLAAILLSFQSPIVDLLIASKIPVLSTSAVGRIIVLFSFSFAVLAGFGFDRIFSDIAKRKFGYIIMWILGFCAVFALLWGIAAFKIFIPADKAIIALSNLKLPTLLFITFVVTIIVACVMKHKHALIILPAILILLVSVDMVRFAAKWTPFMPANLVYPEVSVGKFLSKIPKQDRVFGNFGAESYITHKVAGVDGYDPLYIARYGEFLNAASDGLYHSPGRTGVNFSKNGEYTPVVTNLLGIKYFVNKVADGRQVWAFPVWEYPTDQFKMVYEDSAYQVFENQKAFPRAFVVSDFVMESNKRNILKKVFRSGADLRNVAIVEEDMNIVLSGATGSAKITSYQPNKIQIETESTGSALLVLSDPYYPGWKATVNGNLGYINRVDYALRGILIPQGKNKVELIYNPESFRKGLILGGLGILGVLGIGIYSLLSFPRRRESR